jgi:hypothetical protein
MKKIFLIVITLFCILTCSKANGKEIKGLLITKNVTLYKSASKQATKVGILYGSRICLPNEEVAGFIDKTSNHGKRYYFSLIDATERIEINGLWAKYYQPAQDDVPAQYIDMKEFEQATKDVTIYLQAPVSWEVGKTYVLEAENKKITSGLLNISITPIRITTNATLTTWEDLTTPEDSSTVEKGIKVPIRGKVVFKVVSNYDNKIICTTYIYEDPEIELTISSDYGEGSVYEKLEIDTNGKIFLKNINKKKKKPITKLEAVRDIPSLAFIGWLSADRMVIDSEVYVRKINKRINTAR